MSILSLTWNTLFVSILSCTRVYQHSGIVVLFRLAFPLHHETENTHKLHTPCVHIKPDMDHTLLLKDSTYGDERQCMFTLSDESKHGSRGEHNDIT